MEKPVLAKILSFNNFDRHRAKGVSWRRFTQSKQC